MSGSQLLEFPPLEITSHQGVCCAGVAALDYATSKVKLDKTSAVAVSSELASRLFINTKFEAQTKIKQGDKLSFDAEFLRWMLSDGAGAYLIQNHLNPKGISLRVDWIENISYSNAYPLCMYAGTNSTSKHSWMNYSYTEAAANGVINLRQNIRLLDEVIKLGVAGWLKLIEAGKINPQEVDWAFLEHDLILYNFVYDYHQAEKNHPDWLQRVKARGLNCDSIQPIEVEINLTKPRWLRILDLESASELFKVFYSLCLTSDEFARAVLSLQFDESVGIYAKQNNR